MSHYTIACIKGDVDNIQPTLPVHCIHITTSVLLKAHVPSRGCQFVAQPAYFMIEWSGSQTDSVMSSDESFMVMT